MIKGIINDSDIIIDGLDNMRSRYNLNFMAVTLGKPYVFASAIENYGNLSSIVPGKTPCLNEFYGDFKDRELPTKRYYRCKPGYSYIDSFFGS